MLGEVRDTSLHQGQREWIEEEINEERDTHSRWMYREEEFEFNQAVERDKVQLYVLSQFVAKLKQELDKMEGTPEIDSEAGYKLRETLGKMTEMEAMLASSL